MSARSTRLEKSAAGISSRWSFSREKLCATASHSNPIRRVVRKPSFIVGALLVLAISGISAGLLYRHYARIRWVHEVAVPELEKLALDTKGVAFRRLAQQAERYSPGDPALKQVEVKNLWPYPILTTPQGVDVSFREYGDPHASWECLGKTPLGELQLIGGQYALKFVKDGYEPLEVTSEYSTKDIILDPIGTLPMNMAHIPPGEVSVAGLAPMQLDDFLIDKYEVTNLEFKKFIDAGGYREAKYRKFPFTKDGHTLVFEQAVALFSG